MATYGENFRKMRQRAGLSQEAVAALLKYAKDRNSNVSTLEKGNRIPKPATIRRHAMILRCETWELLLGVKTETDLLREGGPTLFEQEQVQAHAEVSKVEYAIKRADRAAARNVKQKQTGRRLAQKT